MGDIRAINQEIIIKLILAVIIGGFTGYEREKSNQFAGFRTHILVAIGSCITSIIALELFNRYSNISTMDPARLPAQVLSGIGFLGAGAILKNSNGIRGLTTAAGIWTTACIGIAIGYGQYVAAITAWLLAIGTLYILKRIDKIISPKFQTVLKASITSLDAISAMINSIKTNEIIIRDFQITARSENIWEVNFLLVCDRRLLLDNMVSDLKNVKNVLNVDYIKRV